MALHAGPTVLPVPGGLMPGPSLTVINASSLSNTSTLADPAAPLLPTTLSLIRPAITILLLGLLLYRIINYFTRELPPLNSGLKRLPGPWSTLPYLGRIHDVDRNAPWTAMKKFSDQYNGLFSCTLGGETHIWISREDVAQDLLCVHANISSDRANLGAYPDVKEGYKYVPLIGFTEHHFRQRKFAQNVLRNRGYQGYIDQEAKRLMYKLLKEPEGFYDAIDMYCARISTRLAYGSAESAQEHITNSKKFIHQLGPSGPLTNLVPFLGYLPEWIVGDIRDVRLRQEREERVWTQLYEETKRKHQDPQQDMPWTYVKESMEMREGGEKEQLVLPDPVEAKFAVGMLCIVAIFTVQGPAILFVMAMVLHPEWQEKIRAEIDEVTGDDDLVEWKHFARLPTLRAAIKECVRWKSTVPLGVPRELAADYTYDGYHFPKGGIVHVLDIAVSQDHGRYDEPEKYNPGRWLDPNNRNFKGPLTEYPRLKGSHVFGRGKRACPGQEMAETELFIMAGNLVKYFTFSPKLEANGSPIMPDPSKRSVDVIGGPLPFECDIKIRGERRRGVVERMYNEEIASEL